jgi:hypothetical protein
MPIGDRHGWNDLQHYLDIHESVLARYEPYFLLENHLEYLLTDEATLLIRGRLNFVGNLFLEVSKTLAISDRNQVRTIRYKYHAGLAGPDNRPLFRYDNAHPYSHHPDEHHRHCFSHETWQEDFPPKWVGREACPTLGDVIAELEEWWQEIGRFAFPGDDENQ